MHPWILGLALLGVAIGLVGLVAELWQSLGEPNDEEFDGRLEQLRRLAARNDRVRGGPSR